MTRVSRLAIALSLASCTYGDATLRLQGQVVDGNGTPVNSCLMALHVVDGSYQSQAVAVPSSWRESFAVAPTQRTYYVAISCAAGQSGKSRSFTFPNELKVVELGKIVVHGTEGTQPEPKAITGSGSLP